MKNMPAFPIKSVNIKLSGLLKPISTRLVRAFPKTSYNLEVAGLEMDAYTFMSLGLLNSFTIFSVLFIVLVSIAAIQSQVQSFLLFSTIGSGIMATFTMFYWISYPTVYAKRKSEMIEKDLLFALRDISVQTSGGMSFKESIDSITDGYGELSLEMRRVSEEIGFGTPIEDALENSLKRNVSPVYRTVIIRIVDGLRTGIDVSNLLFVVINNLGEDLKNKVRKYGQEINTWVTLYLVIGIVLPSMGLTLMIMLSSFSGISLTASTFYMITLLLMFFHISALSMLKSRRPVVEI